MSGRVYKGVQADTMPGACTWHFQNTGWDDVPVVFRNLQVLWTEIRRLKRTVPEQSSRNTNQVIYGEGVEGKLRIWERTKSSAIKGWAPGIDLSRRGLEIV